MAHREDHGQRLSRPASPGQSHSVVGAAWAIHQVQIILILNSNRLSVGRKGACQERFLGELDAVPNPLKSHLNVALTSLTQDNFALTGRLVRVRESVIAERSNRRQDNLPV